MLNDVASKVPVLIDRSNGRAILTGDGSGNPRLEYLRGRDVIRPGDRILTSGDGGVFPRGLPVGVAYKSLDGRWRVALAADASSIDFVRILKFDDFAQLADDKALAPGAIPTLKTEDPKALSQPNPAEAAAAMAAAKAAAATGAAKPKPVTSVPKPATPKPAPPKTTAIVKPAAPKPAEPKPAPAVSPAGVPY
jgi:rod shape-determining protein MreC